MTRELDIAACFDDFAESSGEEATINSEPVSVVILRRVDVQDEGGNVRNIAALVYVLKADLPAWSSGDLLAAPSGNVKLQQVFMDNGTLQKIEATPVV